ncbi:hypothetical protein ACQJBY_027027 [Aegilops geniculata]
MAVKVNTHSIRGVTGSNFREHVRPKPKHNWHIMKKGFATKQAKSCVLHQNTKDSRSHHMPNLFPFLFPIFFSSPSAVE